MLLGATFAKIAMLQNTSNPKQKMTLHIKYMVSLCCIKMVRTELDKLEIKHGTVARGEVEVDELDPAQRSKLKTTLAKSGFLLMDDPKAILIEKIKNLIIDMMHYSGDEMPKINYSDYISEQLGYDFKYLSRIFSDAKGITIENYIIAHKVERIKELILYDELSLTQISYQLNYSSLAHLSNQFKKVTGLTPSYFKQMKNKKRIVLEHIGEVEDD